MSWPLWSVDPTLSHAMRLRDMIAASLISFLAAPLVMLVLAALIAAAGATGVAAIAFFTAYAGFFGWLAVPVALPILYRLRAYGLIGLAPALLTGAVSAPGSIALIALLMEGGAGLGGINVVAAMLLSLLGMLFGGIFWLALRLWRPTAFRRPAPLTEVFE